MSNKHNKKNNKAKGNGRGRRSRGRRGGGGGGGGLLVSAFPTKTFRTLKYTDNKMLTETAAGAGASNVYSLNGLYDPDFSGVGGQPMWFDQLLSVNGPYLKYRVTSVTITVIFGNNTAGNLYCYLNCTASNAIPASLLAAQQKPMSKYRMLNPSTSGKGQTTFKLRVSVAKVLGVTNQHLLNDDYYAGSYTANPLSQPFLQLGIYAAPGGAVVGQANYTLEIDYHAQIYQLSPNATTS